VKVGQSVDASWSGSSFLCRRLWPRIIAQESVDSPTADRYHHPTLHRG
jgi:hypothetical protein